MGLLESETSRSRRSLRSSCRLRSCRRPSRSSCLCGERRLPSRLSSSLNWRSPFRDRCRPFPRPSLRSLPLRRRPDSSLLWLRLRRLASSLPQLRRSSAGLKGDRSLLRFLISSRRGAGERDRGGDGERGDVKSAATGLGRRGRGPPDKPIAALGQHRIPSDVFVTSTHDCVGDGKVELPRCKVAGTYT